MLYIISGLLLMLVGGLYFVLSKKDRGTVSTTAIVVSLNLAGSLTVVLGIFKLFLSSSI